MVGDSHTFCSPNDFFSNALFTRGLSGTAIGLKRDDKREFGAGISGDSSEVSNFVVRYDVVSMRMACPFVAVAAIVAAGTPFVFKLARSKFVLIRFMSMPDDLVVVLPLVVTAPPFKTIGFGLFVRGFIIGFLLGLSGDVIVVVGEDSGIGFGYAIAGVALSCEIFNLNVATLAATSPLP